MFDVSFGELLLILIVGLLVFGPEKLPHAVRTASLWMGRFRRSFNQMRAEIEREVGVEEFKRDLHNQQILDSLRDVKKDLTDAQREIDQLPHSVEQAQKHFEAEIDAAQSAIPTPAEAQRQSDIQNNDLQHHAPAADAIDYEQQNRDIEQSVQPAPAPDRTAERS